MDTQKNGLSLCCSPCDITKFSCARSNGLAHENLIHVMFANSSYSSLNATAEMLTYPARLEL